MAVISQQRKVFNLSARFFTFPKKKSYNKKNANKLFCTTEIYLL